MAERELVSSMGGSQQGNGTSLLMDYDQEWMGKSELRVEDDGGERKRKKRRKMYNNYNISHLSSLYSCH